MEDKSNQSKDNKAIVYMLMFGVTPFVLLLFDVTNGFVKFWSLLAGITITLVGIGILGGWIGEKYFDSDIGGLGCGILFGLFCAWPIVGVLIEKMF